MKAENKSVFWKCVAMTLERVKLFGCRRGDTVLSVLTLSLPDAKMPDGGDMMMWSSRS